jgi:hypothetical protein
MEIRARNTYRKSYSGIRYTITGSPPDQGTTTLFGNQRTESQGNPVSLLSKKTGQDIGGNFRTERWFAPKPALTRFESRPGQNFDLIQPLWPGRPPVIFLNEKPAESLWSSSRIGPSTDVLLQRGTTAIARVTPTNAIASVATSLGELREGLPSIPVKTALKNNFNPASLAGEYLNLEFAIKPTLSDIAKYRKAYAQQDQKLKQLYRDSGRMVRRRYTFPPEVTTVTTNAPGLPWGPVGLSSRDASVGNLETVTRTENRYIFSGAFTYFLPKQEGFHRKMDELDAVYGIYPDADALWQLMPWSWAIDWVSNTGDLIQNLSSFSQDGLVLRYGYIMCHTLVQVDQTWTGQLCEGSFRLRRLHTQYRYEQKQRLRATPYGFGLNITSFSSRQKAIIAALGISWVAGRK